MQREFSDQVPAAVGLMLLLSSLLIPDPGSEVTAVKFTARLTDSPCIVTSTLSPHLRKMMKNMMQGQGDPGAAMPCTMEVRMRSSQETGICSPVSGLARK